MDELFNLFSAKITFSLQKESNGIVRLQKPDKIYLDNTNLSFALIGLQPNSGTLRETFFANQLRHQHSVNLAEHGDFLIDHKYTFEVGGQNKGKKQIVDIDNSYVVADNIEYGNSNRIPLWMFGMLY